jgi:hypothetical protein
MPRRGEQENKQERRQRYREWLEGAGHRGMWGQWGTIDDHGKKAVRHDIVALMKKDGVLARSTMWQDVKMLPELLDQLWKEYVGA